MIEIQKSWIGKRKGFNVKFRVESVNLTAFTTKVGIIYGVKFFALSTEIQHLISFYSDLKKDSLLRKTGNFAMPLCEVRVERPLF